MRKLLGITLTLAIVSAASAGILWDNNIETNGTNGRAISPPSFPNIRVADDFVVPASGWTIEVIHYGTVEDANWRWSDGDGIDVTVYENDNNGLPGNVVAVRSPGGTKMKTGKTFFGRAEYHYWADFSDDGIKLEAGTYWISVRHPTGAGVGTNYWLTSDGGPDGADSEFGAFSLDSGNTWNDEGGPTWHHTFMITGKGIGGCDPCDANCDGSVDLTDVEPFIGLLFGEDPCNHCTGDTNDDGSVDLTDVEGFIACLLG